MSLASQGSGLRNIQPGERLWTFQFLVCCARPLQPLSINCLRPSAAASPSERVRELAGGGGRSRGMGSSPPHGTWADLASECTPPPVPPPRSLGEGAAAGPSGEPRRKCENSALDGSRDTGAGTSRSGPRQCASASGRELAEIVPSWGQRSRPQRLDPFQG